MVTAPAGSGKTQLLSQWWDQGWSGSRMWLTLDDADRDPRTFLHSLLQAIRQVEAGATALDGLRPPPPGAPDPTYVAEVALALSRLPDPMIVVLDDFHRLVDSPSERLLATLFRTSPEPLRLAILSRGTPFGLERAQFAGWLDHLSAADLALTLTEIEELVRLRAPGRPTLSASALWRRTRGWLLGTLVEIEELSAGQRRTLLEDFFDAEVLAPLSSADRHLVECAVTVDPVCGRLLDALTERPAGGALALDALHHAGVFLGPTGPDDDRCAWFRWQPQFRTVLAERLARNDEQLAQTLHRAATRWLRDEGRTDEAAGQALSAGDRAQAAEILTRNWLVLLHTGRVRGLDDVLSRFTEEERATHPELAAACAVIRAVENDLTRSCRCAEQAMTASPARNRERRLTIEAASAGVHLYRATLTGVANSGPETARRLLDRLDPARGPCSDSGLALQSHLAHLLGAWEVHTLDLDDAQRILDDVLDLATRLGDRPLVLRCEAQLARVDANTGHLTRSLARARTVLDAADATTVPQATAVAEIATAEVLVLRAQPLEALAHLTAAQRLTPTEDTVSRVTIAILTMIALLALGRVASAREQLELLRSELPGGWSSVPVLEDQLIVAEARQLLAEGSPDDALRILPEHSSTRSAALGTRVETVRAWAGYLLPDPPRVATDRVEPRPSRTPDDVAALVLDSLAAHRAGRDDLALGALELALKHSSEEQVALPFLLMATELRPLLRDLVEAGTAHEDWALQLIETMTTPTTTTPTGVAYVEPLTPRELEVLRALQGTSPAEAVAARLFVSMNTLRTHVKHINRKLGTGSRREAVARARELALL